MSCFQSREPAPVTGKWNKTILIDLAYILHSKRIEKCSALIVVLFMGHSRKPFPISVCVLQQGNLRAVTGNKAGAYIPGAMRNDL